LLDVSGGRNGWYELLDDVRKNDVIYHWHARESQFVGRSTVLSSRLVEGSERVVPLAGFEPLVGVVDLAELRSRQAELTAIRDSLHAQHPDAVLYLPFQFRRDGLRLMSN